MPQTFGFDSLQADSPGAAGTVGELKGLLSQVHNEVASFATDLRNKLGGLDARMNEVEQKLARRGGGSRIDTSFHPFGGGGGSLGSMVVADSAVQNLIGSPGRRGRAIVNVGGQLAAITTVTAGATRDVLVPPDRRPDILALPSRRLTIRALLNASPTTSNNIQAMRETGFTNNAAVVSEGAEKPESDMTFELVDFPVRTIAHWVQASKQILDDAPVLQNHVDTRLRYGVTYAEEVQLLYGDGTGENLHGMVTQAEAWSDPLSLDSASSEIDILGSAIAQAQIAQLPATGVVLNDQDFFKMMLIKDGQGRYILGSPLSTAFTTIWGLPVVPTPAMTAGHFLVGAFGLAATIYDREQATVEISTEDRDNFVRNLVTLRGEERLSLAVTRPEALVYGAF